METENLQEKIEIKIPAELYWLLAKYAAESSETTESFTTKILIDAIRFILRRQAIEVNEGRKRLFDLQVALFNQTGEPEDYQEPYHYDWEGVKEREDKKEVAAEEYIPPEFNFEQSNSSSFKEIFSDLFGKNSDEENSTVNHSQTEPEYQDNSMSENDENIKDQNPKSKDKTKKENWDA